MDKPGVFDRLKLAWEVYNRGMPRRYTGKAAPFAWPTWREGKPQWQIINYQTYVDEGFNLNTLIYSAIMYKVRAMTAAPLRAYMGDPEKPEPAPENSPLAQLVARPNPSSSWTEFHGLGIVYLNIAGNCYVYLDRGDKLPSEGTLPEAMYLLRPDRVFIIPGTEDGRAGVQAFLYVPEGKAAWGGWNREERRQAVRDGRATPMLPQDIMHVKLPNPSDPLEGLGYGLSPMSPLAYSADVDNAVTRFLKIFFESGTMAQGLLKFDTPMDKEDVARARARWKEIYGGYENWDEVAVLDQGGTFERITPSFDEMGFGAIDERNETRILGPFGVPGALIGTRIGLNRATYSNLEELRRMFWEDTMFPETRLFETEYQYYLQDESLFVKFDLSEVPALRVDIAGLVETWKTLVDRGVPKDVAAQVISLQLPALPDDGIGYMPMTMVPVAQIGQRPATSPTPDGAPKPEAEEDEEERGLGKA